MADQALYRKYRSGSFSDVVGQDHVVRTLQTAVSTGRISHAYLFTGPRGVGKTSVARLLARALNCTGDPRPCNKCANCQAAINSSLDVVEIDAASNRSIDSIRELRDKIALAPTRGQYKIYIIDEVHMLTTEAFNALLKTLEEPPAHVVFVLATTEVHKVPDTIISRTQRFNFRPIKDADLMSHLITIAQREQIDIEPEAMNVIVSAAQGGARDAISLLDQLAAAGSSPITVQQARDLLGYTSQEEIVALASAIAVNDAGEALSIVERLVESGAQPMQTAIQLVDHWRAVLLAATGADKHPQEAVAVLAKSVGAVRSAFIIDELLGVLRSQWPVLALEATLVRLSSQDSNSPKRIAANAPQPVRTVPSRQVAAPAESGAPSGQQQASSDLDPGLWPKVLVLVKADNNSLSALMQMYPVDFTGDEVTIKPRFNFHRDIFLKPANRTTIENAAAKVYGRKIRLQARTEDTGTKSKGKKTDTGTELVASALEILGGEIVE